MMHSLAINNMVLHVGAVVTAVEEGIMIVGDVKPKIGRNPSMRFPIVRHGSSSKRSLEDALYTTWKVTRVFGSFHKMSWQVW